MSIAIATIKCTTCDGHGDIHRYHPDGPEICPDCDGSGLVPIQEEIAIATEVEIVECDYCDGSGKIFNYFNEKVNCPKCIKTFKSEEQIKAEVKELANFLTEGFKILGIGDDEIDQARSLPT